MLGYAWVCLADWRMPQWRLKHYPRREANERTHTLDSIGRNGCSSRTVLFQRPIAIALLGAHSIQLGLPIRIAVRDPRGLHVGQMNRLVVLGGVVCIGVLSALRTLMSVFAGYINQIQLS